MKLLPVMLHSKKIGILIRIYMISFNSCVANGQCKKSLLTPIGEVDFENFDKAKMAICTDENEECCDSRIIIKESISSECNIENGYDCRHAHGGFQLEFVSISQVINHMTCYNFECSHW